MTSARPSFVAVMIAGYSDMQRVLRSLWPLALVAALVLIGAEISGAIAPHILARGFSPQLLFKRTIDLTALALIAPFLIATHRFVLLGEVTRRYVFEPANPRFCLFTGWLVVLGLVAFIPALCLIASTPVSPIYYVGRPPPNFAPAQALLVLAVAITVLVFLTRLAILLPAIAVDAPGATWQNALQDTGRNAWFIVLTSLLAPMPLLLPGLGALWLLWLVSPWPGLVRGAGVIIGPGLLFIALVLGVVMVSRFYQVLGNRLNQPPPA
jgi:hypothetical protein